MRDWRLAVLILAPLWLMGCKTSAPHKAQRPVALKAEPKVDDRVERRFDKAAVILEHRGDADSLAAAALLRGVRQRDQALALAVRASAAAPERPELAWLRVQVCNSTPYCDAQSLEPDLRRLDPSNGIGWMGELARAVSVGDQRAQDAALQAMGRAQYFDVYWTPLIGRLAAALHGTGLSPGEAMVYLNGAYAVYSFPPLSPASTSCKGARLQRADILAACRGVARVFENGDTDLVEMIGAAIATQVWPDGSAERAAALRRRQVFDYREALWRVLSTQMLGHKAWAERYIALCKVNRREQDVVRVQLLEAGKNPEPPLT